MSLIIGDWPDDLLAATAFLTRIPMPRRDTRASLARAYRAFPLVLRLPISLRDRFIRRQERKQDETIHLALVLARGGTIRIEAAFGIHSDVWDLATDSCAQVGRYRLGQGANAGPPREQARPIGLNAAAQRRHRSHPRHDYSAHPSSLDLCAKVPDVAAPTRSGDLPCHRISPDSRKTGGTRGRDKTVRLMSGITTEGDAADGSPQ
jgi:hypothetical protein